MVVLEFCKKSFKLGFSNCASPSLPSFDQLLGRLLRVCRLRGAGGVVVVCGGVRRMVWFGGLVA